VHATRTESAIEERMATLLTRETGRVHPHRRRGRHGPVRAPERARTGGSTRARSSCATRAAPLSRANARKTEIHP
jgi:hypothetical protein